MMNERLIMWRKLRLGCVETDEDEEIAGRGRIKEKKRCGHRRKGRRNYR